MTTYTCPECRAELVLECLDTLHPIYYRKCLKCGWAIMITPHTEPNIKGSTLGLTSQQACRKCSNHPLNGGTGICYCTLGTPKIT